MYRHVAPYTCSSVSVNRELTCGSDSVDREGPKVMSVTASVNRVGPPDRNCSLHLREKVRESVNLARTHEIAYLRAGTRLIARFRVKFRLFAYTQFGEKYSNTREIVRGKALLAPAAFLPEGTNRFCHASAEVRLQFSPYFACKLTQFCAISRERAQKHSCYCASLHATRIRSREIH